VSPSIWAWREQRAVKIGQSADRVLCLFPMEPAVYAKHGVDARFVGHPLADAFALEPDQHAARESLGLRQGVPVLALLPGSRLGEIRRLGADFIAAAILLAKEIPDLHVVAPMANDACRLAFASALAKAGIENGESRMGKSEAAAGALASTDSRLTIPDSRSPTPHSPFPILVLNGQSHTAMIAADAVLLASGTAALEAMLAKRPMVVAYRLAELTYRIVKGFGLLKVERYSLPNHLAGRELVPELMQERCTPEALARELRKPLLERRIAPDLLAEYTRLHSALRGNANRDAAAAIFDQ
jgi:lipid-A-disaccharide synthase